MTQTFFITGTDTGVGKTTCSVALLQYFAAQQLKTIGMKPIESGGLENSDTVALQKAATIELPRSLINPYQFAPPIAPHLAAAEAGITLTVEKLVTAYRQLPAADRIVIEGAGGWLTPLNARETYADFVSHLKIPVILVVGIRLGCLNHTLLTVENILRRGCELYGWVANRLDPTSERQLENIEYLRSQIPNPELSDIMGVTAMSFSNKYQHQ